MPRKSTKRKAPASRKPVAIPKYRRSSTRKPARATAANRKFRRTAVAVAGSGKAKTKARKKTVTEKQRKDAMARAKQRLAEQLAAAGSADSARARVNGEAVFTTGAGW